MKTGSDRKYTAEFRDSAVKQVTDGGRGMAAVARSLEMSNKTLANWVYLARKGQALVVAQAAGKSLNQWATEVLRSAVQADGQSGERTA